MNPQDTNLFHEQSEVADALLGFCEPLSFSIDSLFDPSPELLVDYDASSPSPLLPSFIQPSLSDSGVLSLPSTDLNYHCPKRPKSCSDLYEPSSLVLDYKSYNVPTTTRCNLEEKPSIGGLSAQSVAARERRKKISEKTRELGRLIPGGNRMNTAEMLQCAYKYVKFLQAQVSILTLMSQIKNYENSAEVDEHLQVLLTSSCIQEKLYGDANCVIPKDLVVLLAEDCDIKASPLIFRDIRCFVETLTRFEEG